MTFRHKELQTFFLSGKRSKIHQSHIKKLRLILARLNTIKQISDMNFPGSGLHQLKGSMLGFLAVNVNGNWRLTFRFENENVYDVDYLDYH